MSCSRSSASTSNAMRRRQIGSSRRSIRRPSLSSCADLTSLIVDRHSACWGPPVDAKLDLRIRQLHEAMGDVRTEDLSSIRTETGIIGSWHYVHIDFSGAASDAQLANVVSLCLANIACLKDHLKA